MLYTFLLSGLYSVPNLREDLHLEITSEYISGMFQFRDYFEYCKVEATKNGNIVFTDVTLKKPIGDFRIGTYFDCVLFSWASMDIVFYDIDRNVLMYRNFCLLDTPMEN